MARTRRGQRLERVALIARGSIHILLCFDLSVLNLYNDTKKNGEEMRCRPVPAILQVEYAQNANGILRRGPLEPRHR